MKTEMLYFTSHIADGEEFFLIGSVTDWYYVGVVGVGLTKKRSVC
jgi:hypothetical protein